MFGVLLRRSFSRGFRHKLLAIITIAAGASLATAMLNISLTAGDKVAYQLRSFGANLVLVPQTSLLPTQDGGNQNYLDEKELKKIKMIFWRNNISSFSPYLQTKAKVENKTVKVVGTWFNKKLVIPTGESFISRLSNTKPWLRIKGSWPQKDSEIALSTELAKKLRLSSGQKIRLELGSKSSLNVSEFSVSGIFSGGQEEDFAYVHLKKLQEVLNVTGKVSQVEISALTVPDDELAIKYQENTSSLTSKESEVWYCTAYVDSIAFQLEEAIPSAKAKVIRQLAHAESLILGKIQFFMLLLTIAALAASALGISSLMTASVLERSNEIGLAKAIGASNSAVVALFLAEASILGLVGSVFGYFLGMGLAAFISNTVFQSEITFNYLVPFFSIFISVSIAILGSLTAVRTITTLNTKEVLHGR